MDLSFLIPSKVRRSLLQYWVKNPENEIGIRALARELGLSPQESFRELCNLESWGLLFSSKRGPERVFRLNQRFPFYPVVKELFEKWESLHLERPIVDETLDWKTLSKQYKKIPVPPDLVPGLKSKRVRPRAYAEETMMKRKGML